MTKQNSNTPVLVEHQFNGKAINQRDEDGYVSATAMCQSVNKRMNNYNQNDATKEYLEALSADTGIPASELIQTLKGGNGQQGTWVHPKVAIHLAQWLSPQFAVQVTNWVYDWMNGKSSNPVMENESIPLASCTPIMFHGTAILMLHRPKKDWVCFRSLCDVMGIDYKHHHRAIKDAGFHFAQIEQTGEKIFCISYQSAVSWLQNINPEKIRLNKRHKVVTAMLQLPKLLTEARDTYRQATPSVPKAKLEHVSRAKLLAALEKIEGKKLAVMPCEEVLAFDSKVNEIRRQYWHGLSDLGHNLLKTGFTMKSLHDPSIQQLELQS